MNTEKTNRLLNRVAIVSGAGSRDIPNDPDIVGNGRATSILLARAGAFVVVVDINKAWAQRTQELIDSAPTHLNHGPNRTLVVRADVTRPSDCKAVVQAAVEKWGRLDILVNNVGVGGADGTAVEVDVEEWREGMDINVLSMVLMSKYAIPEMLRTGPTDISRGTGKAIVNMSSVSGMQGGKQWHIYPTVCEFILCTRRRTLSSISDIQRCHSQLDTSDGRPSRPLWHPSQLRSPRDSIYTYDCGGWDARSGTYTSKKSGSSKNRRLWMGCRKCGRVLGQ